MRLTGTIQYYKAVLRLSNPGYIDQSLEKADGCSSEIALALESSMASLNLGLEIDLVVKLPVASTRRKIQVSQVGRGSLERVVTNNPC